MSESAEGNRNRVGEVAAPASRAIRRRAALRRTDRGSARVALIAVIAFVVGGAAIGLGVWLGWGSTPGGGHARGPGATTTPPGIGSGGHSRHRPPSPIADSLAAIWCGSQGDCIAVGNDDHGPVIRSLAERRTSSRSGWTLMTTAPVPGASLDELAAVSCQGSTPDWCVAVGTALSPERREIAEVFRDHSWHLMAAPHGGRGASLDGVACTAVGRCIAVGVVQQGLSEHPLIEQLTGGKWTVLRPARGTGAAALSSVSCQATGVCVAVGQATSNGRQVPLAEALTGASWSLTASALPAGAAGGGIFSSVACAPGHGGSASLRSAPGSCVAVGVQYDNVGTASPLIEQRSGTGPWLVVTVHTSGAGAFSGTLLGVSCASPGNCVAVGSRRGGSSGGAASGKVSSLEPLVVSEVKGGWSLGSRVDVQSSAATLSAVSCPAGSTCAAVGSALARPGRIATLVVLVGSGPASIQHSPSPGISA